MSSDKISKVILSARRRPRGSDAIVASESPTKALTGEVEGPREQVEVPVANKPVSKVYGAMKPRCILATSGLLSGPKMTMAAPMVNAERSLSAEGPTWPVVKADSALSYLEHTPKPTPSTTARHK